MPVQPSALGVVRANVARAGDIQAGVERSLSDGVNLRVIARSVIQLAETHGIQYSAVGARGVYAGALAKAVVLIEPGRDDLSWFAIRDEPKGHGTRSITEGARLVEGQRVLLVDTVATPDALLATCNDLISTAGVQIAGIIPVTEVGPEVQTQIKQGYPAAIYAPLIGSGLLK